MSRTVLALVALSGLLFLPTVSAQTGPVLTLNLVDLPTGPVTTNETLYVEIFSIHVTAQNIVCPATKFRVMVEPTLQATSTQSSGGANSTVDFDLTPDQPAMDVPAGEYVSQKYDASLEATLVIEPQSIPYNGRDVPLGLKATMQSNSDCKANGDVKAPDATQPLTIRFARGTEAAPVTPSPAMPGPGLALLGLGLLAAAVVFSRRRPGA
jgi:hypothetical protein